MKSSVESKKKVAIERVEFIANTCRRRPFGDYPSHLELSEVLS